MLFSLVLWPVAAEIVCETAWRGDGHCDPACMTIGGQFDGLDCQSRCPATCTSELQSNSACDSPCDSWECAWDMGKCTECAVNCPISLLGNAVCDPPCNAEMCNWDSGDCLSLDSPAEYVVESGGKRTVAEVIEALWAPWNWVWLAGRYFELQAEEKFTVLFTETRLVETDFVVNPVSGCTSTRSQVTLSPFHPIFHISHRVFIENIDFSGYFPLSPPSPFTYCPHIDLGSDGIYRNDRGETVIPTIFQSTCDEYSLYSFITVAETGAVTMRNVSFAGFRQQLKAIVEVKCGNLEMERVDFVDSLSDFSGLSGGLILAYSQNSSLCGSFLYRVGRISLLNNGYEYISALPMSGFLALTLVRTVTIADLACSFNFLGADKGAFMHFQDCGAISIANISMEYHFSGLCAGVFIEKTTQTPTIDGLPAVFLSNFSMIRSSSMGVTALRVYFHSAVPSVVLEKLHFDSDFSPLLSVVDVSAEEVTAGSGESYVTLTDLYANSTQGLSLLRIARIPRVSIQYIHVENTGITMDSQDVVLSGFVENQNSYIQTLSSYSQVSDCSENVLLSDISALFIHDSLLEHNNCPYGISGFSLRGAMDTVMPRQDCAISDSNFTYNTGAGAISVRTSSRAAFSSLFFTGNRNILTGESPCIDISLLVPSEIVVTSVRFVGNSALSGTAILAYSVKSLYLLGVSARGNSAKASCAGVLVNPCAEIPSLVSISHSEFVGNTADSYGAVAVLDMDSILLGNRKSVLDFQVSDCSFSDNQSNSQGSSITLYKFVQLSQNSLISRCDFARNSSNRGPGVYCEYETGTVTVTNCRFSDNQSAKGSAVLAHQYPPSDIMSVVRIEYSEFTNNVGSAAVALDGWERPTLLSSHRNVFSRNSGAVQSSTGVFSDSDSTYVGNGGKNAAVLKFVGSNCTMDNATVRDNVGKTNGGAFFLSSRSSLTVRNSLLCNNSASFLGGVVYSDESSVSSFLSCNISSNSASQGSFAYLLSSNISLSHCKLAENTAGSSFLIVISEGNGEVTNSEIGENSAGTNPGISAAFSSLKVANSRFYSQRSVQGSFVFSGKESNVRLENSSFARGFASLKGGAVYCVMGCVLSISYTSFEDCAAGDEGGVVFLRNSNATITKVTVKSVQTATDGGSVAMYGGTVVVQGSEFRNTTGSAMFGQEMVALTVSNSLFTIGDNFHGGFVSCTFCKSLRVEETEFVAGSGEMGGALYVRSESGRSSRCQVSRTNFTRNSGKVGGAARLENVYCELVGNEFAYNSAAESGGGVSVACSDTLSCGFNFSSNRFLHNSALTSGGAIDRESSLSILLSLNSFLGNSALYGSEIAARAVTIAPVSGARMAEELVLKGIASGQTLTREITVGMFDEYGELVSTANGYVAELSPSVNSTLILGGDLKSTSQSGVFLFRNFLLVAPPGSLQSAQISVPSLPPLSLSLFFRSCTIGESENNQQCLLCPAQTYSLDPKTPCYMCPEAAICYGNYSMVPKKGFWRVSNMTDRFFECFKGDACIGSPSTSVLSLTGSCATGYTGNLCQSCSPGFSRNGRNSCSSCPNSSLNITLTVLLLVTLLSALVLLIYVSISNATKPKSLTAIHLKILINYLQLVVIASSINVKWPAEIQTLLAGQERAGAATEQLSSYICLAQEMGYEDAPVFITSKLITILPGCLLVLTSLYWLLVSRCRHLSFLREKLVCGWILSLFSLHPTLTKEMLSLFACMELQKNEQWLISEMSIRCWQGAHIRELLTVALPSLIVWVIGLPAIALTGLVTMRRSLGLRQTLLMMGFLYRGYEPSSFYWEFVIMTRKVIAIALVVSLSTQSVQLQSLSVLACLLTFFYMHVHKKPFCHASLNALEGKSIFVSLLTIYSGLYFSSQDIGNVYTDSVTTVCLFSLLVCANGYFLLAWLRAAGPNLFQSLKDTCSSLFRTADSYTVRRREIEAIEEEEEVSRIAGVSHTVSPPNVSKIEQASFTLP